MQVFKAYFKIIKQNLVGTLIYFTVFLAISILVSNSSPKTQINQNFEDITLDVAVVNLDQSTPLTREIEGLLAKNNNIIEVDQSEDAIKEALFFSQIDYAIFIPEGFTQSFLAGAPIDIISYRVPNSYISVFLDLKMNQFLNNLRLYEQFTTQELIDNIQVVRKTMANETTVVIEAKDIPQQTSGIDFFASYSSYIIVAAILYCVTTFMILFNNSLVRKRTDCSPIRPLLVDVQMTAANFVLALITVAVLIVTATLLYRSDAWTPKSMLYYALMLVYSLMCIGLAFFVSNFAKSKSILSALVTTMSLGFAFLGGTFVPLAMLGESVKMLGSFTPAFWFTLAVDYLTSTSNHSMANLGPYWRSMGIIALFGIAFLAMGMLLRRTKTAKWM